MKVSVIAFSKRANGLALEIRHCWKEAELWSKYEKPKEGIQSFGELQDCVKHAFQNKELLVFIGATGIAVRLIAPYLINKSKDPAVLVVDETGQFIISLLSGHLGGANAYATELARYLGGIAVITTATDCNNLLSPDLFAKQNHLKIHDFQQLKKITAQLLEQGHLYISDVENRIKDLPQEYQKVYGQDNNLELVIHWKQQNGGKESCYLIPQVVCLGIGCKRGKSKKEIQEVVEKVLDGSGIFKSSVLKIGTIDLKVDEKGLIEFADDFNGELSFYTPEQLMEAEGRFHQSEFVAQITGVDNVCERAAILASNGGDLVVSRFAQNGVTVAIAVIKGA